MSLGDIDVDFSMQSCGKPLLYSFCAESVGLKKVGGRGEGE
jgi:glutaminase